MQLSDVKKKNVEGKIVLKQQGNMHENIKRKKKKFVSINLCEEIRISL